MVVCWALATGAAVTSAAEEDGPPKNLKVLPAETTRAEVGALMKTFTKALGVKCKFCHNPQDFASDEKPHKEEARRFMRMTLELEKTTFAYEGAPKVRFNCYMCHRGSEDPVLVPK
jgi:hypothetical protein